MLPPVGAAAAIFLGFSALFECEGGGLAVFGGRLLIGGRQVGDQMIHFDALVSDGAALALEREATFRRIERAVFGGDVWIEHHENAAAEILIHKSDDALGNADHIGRHAHAARAVVGHELTLHVIPLVGCCRSANIVASHGCETDGWANLSIP